MRPVPPQLHLSAHEKHSLDPLDFVSHWYPRIPVRGLSSVHAMKNASRLRTIPRQMNMQARAPVARSSGTRTGASHLTRAHQHEIKIRALPFDGSSMRSTMSKPKDRCCRSTRENVRDACVRMYQLFATCVDAVERSSNGSTLPTSSIIDHHLGSLFNTKTRSQLAVAVQRAQRLRSKPDEQRWRGKQLSIAEMRVTCYMSPRGSAVKSDQPHSARSASWSEVGEKRDNESERRGEAQESEPRSDSEPEGWDRRPEVQTGGRVE